MPHIGNALAARVFALVCMFSQLSGLVPVAFAILRAIEGLKDALWFTNRDRVFRDTPIVVAASVRVRLRGLVTSSEPATGQ